MVWLLLEDHTSQEDEEGARGVPQSWRKVGNVTAKRITARKYEGDDKASWAVFIDGRPFCTGLTKSEVPYVKQAALFTLSTIANLNHDVSEN